MSTCQRRTTSWVSQFKTGNDICTKPRSRWLNSSAGRRRLTKYKSKERFWTKSTRKSILLQLISSTQAHRQTKSNVSHLPPNWGSCHQRWINSRRVRVEWKFWGSCKTWYISRSCTDSRRCYGLCTRNCNPSLYSSKHIKPCLRMRQQSSLETQARRCTFSSTNLTGYSTRRSSLRWSPTFNIAAQSIETSSKSPFSSRNTSIIAWHSTNSWSRKLLKSSNSQNARRHSEFHCSIKIRTLTRTMGISRGM